MTTEKPGYKTTEFWLTLLVTILGALAASGLLIEGHWSLQLVGMATGVLAALGYSKDRAKTKLGGSLERAEETRAASLGKPSTPAE